MKKKLDKEEKQEKIKRIFKIVGCSIGLLLCGGAFIGLLFVGVRGCSATPRSQEKNAMDNSLSITLNSDKDTPQQSFKPVDFGGTEYYPYVLGGYNLFGNYPTQITGTGTKEYEIDTYINGFKRSRFGCGYGILGNVILNNYVFYNLDYRGQQIDVITIAYTFNNGAVSQILTDINEGDFIYFETSRFDSLINSNLIYFTNLFTSNVLRSYEDVNITFNNVINPWGPWGTNYDYFFNQDISGMKTLFKGLFKDATGTLYKEIGLSYLSAQGMRYGTTTDYQTYSLDGVHFMVMVYYTLDNKQIVVNAQDYGTATSGSQEGNVVMLKSNHFISNLFQTINILTIEDYDNYINPNLNRLVALTSLNNSNNGTATFTGGVSIGGTNPFILIGNAFTSLMPFLSITIIPGLTIGTLLLIPLVGMIVLFVVFLFKR